MSYSMVQVASLSQLCCSNHLVYPEQMLLALFSRAFRLRSQVVTSYLHAALRTAAVQYSDHKLCKRFNFLCVTCHAISAQSTAGNSY